jgi:transcription elongation GreA/GreB family factor
LTVTTERKTTSYLTMEDHIFLQELLLSKKAELSKSSITHSAKEAAYGGDILDRCQAYQILHNDIAPLKKQSEQLSEALANPAIVDANSCSSIEPYCKVIINDSVFGLEEYYLIDPAIGPHYKIECDTCSPESRLGKSMMKRQKNEFIEVDLPTGRKIFKIVSFEKKIYPRT